jgi:hypothetical protein
VSPLGIFSGWSAFDWFKAVFRLVLSALAALPVLLGLNLLPYLDYSREEARRIHTWHETKRIAEKISAKPEDALQQAAAQKDIWGNSYRIEVMPGGHYRVSTPGSDGVLDAPDKKDSDDIHSEMKSAPTEVFKRQRRRQWIIAFAAWGSGVSPKSPMKAHKTCEHSRAAVSSDLQQDGWK